MNTILICVDQQIAYQNLPKEILDKLKGYQILKSLGIEFTNFQCNRQPCSPSRSVLLAGEIDTGILDDVQMILQYDYIKFLNPDAKTFAKDCLKSGMKTAYYGKNHIDSRLVDDIAKVNFRENTSGSMLQYGFEKFSLFGDPGYGYGIVKDSSIMSTTLSSNAVDYDYLDPVTNEKTTGIIPFLKSRLEDSENFFMECHFLNPHDTQNFYQNLSQTPQTNMLQYTCPFLEEQLELYGIEDPYKYSDVFPDAYVKNPNLTANYFEKTFLEYSTNPDSLPFKKSFNLDYVSDPKVGKIVPYLVGSQELVKLLFTLPETKEDLAGWKNLPNNYYGLILEVDLQIYNIIRFLQKNNLINNTNLLLVSDHGDMMTAHGLKQKIFPFRECINVPLMIYSPNIKSSLRGTKSDELISLVEVANILRSIQFKETNSNSLFKLNKCRQLKLNSKKKSRFYHLCNGALQQFAYFTFLAWLFRNNFENIETPPGNFFEFRCFFVLTISNCKEKQYKYGHYYSTVDLLIYNLKDTVFRKANILRPNLKDILPEEFTFLKGYSIVSQNTKLLFEYMIYIISQISIDGVANLAVPTEGDDFLYNITKDPEEVFNLHLLKPKVLGFMKNELALATIENKMIKSITILPIKQYQKLLGIIDILTRNFSIPLEKLSELDFILLSTLIGDNDFDNPADTSSFKANMLSKYSNILQQRINEVKT